MSEEKDNKKEIEVINGDGTNLVISPVYEHIMKLRGLGCIDYIIKQTEEVIMDLNEQMAGEIARQLGLSGRNGVSRDVVRELERKSDAELSRDILRLKKQLAENNISPQQQMAIVKKLMPMMNSEQKARLQKVIELLK